MKQGRKIHKRRNKLFQRKAELHIKLWGLRFEMAKWNKLLERPIKAEWSARSPQEVAKLIGEAEAEYNLINFELLSPDK